MGLIAGACGSFLTTPMDRVTTLILSKTEQSEASSVANESGEMVPIPAPPSAIEALVAIYSEQGVQGLLTGARERTLYWAPAMAIFLSVYCKTRQVFANQLGI